MKNPNSNTGTIHKPCGQILKVILTPTLFGHFYKKKGLCGSHLDTPPPYLSVHEVYGCPHSKNTICLVLSFLCLGFVVGLCWLLKIREEIEDLFLGQLRVIVFGQLVAWNMIPLILIKRNPKIYLFCLNKINFF